MRDRKKFKHHLEETIMKSSNKYQRPLLERIKRRIRWDARISNRDIMIKNTDGVIIAAGTVDSAYRKRALISLIQTTAGVEAVVDQVVISPGCFQSDETLTSRLRKSAEGIQLSSGEWLNVQVNQGAVKLTGQVFRPELKGFASRIAWELSGVRDCVNSIEILDPEKWALSLQRWDLFSAKQHDPAAVETKNSLGLIIYQQEAIGRASC